MHKKITAKITEYLQEYWRVPESSAKQMAVWIIQEILSTHNIVEK